MPTPDAEVQRAINRSVRQAGELFRALRLDLMERLRGATGFEASRLGDLLRALDSGIERWQSGFVEVLSQGQEALAEIGQALVRRALTALGIEVTIPDLTAPLLQALATTRLGLVTNIGEDLRRALAREIQLGVLGVIPPTEAMGRIRDLLDSQGANTYPARAEAIVRTEVGRAQSQATQQQLEIATGQGARVQKQWLHSGNRNPRSDHLAASGQVRAVREPFVIGGARLLYPRDPSAPASATVNCRCVVVPYIG